jgi:glutathione S-transferase
MILIGMFDSPFVRRVAVSLKLLELPFEHRNWSVGKDFELLRQFNPLARVPALVQPDGETLIDSGAILDFLDETAGAERALLPRAGKERRDALRVMALAVGAAEKGLAQLYESAFRPEDKRHGAWVDRCRSQMHGALAELDRVAQTRSSDWMIGGRLTQADVTATCVFTFLCEALDLRDASAIYPGLSALSARCEAMKAFREVRVKFHPPSRTGVIQEDHEGVAQG